MEKRHIEIGDVVQIDPQMKDCFFNGCFMQVTEVKEWGAQGFIYMPGERGKLPGQAYFRTGWENMEYVGPATWTLLPKKVS